MSAAVSCDNPPCIEPGHLLLGTARANNRDREERHRSRVGEAHHAARLTAEQVLQIRARSRAGESLSALAAEFGVRSWTVQKIRDGITWKSLPEVTW